MKSNYLLDPQIVNKEHIILDSINNCISENTSFVFNAGAGAGKTYALVQTLKYVVNKYSKKLRLLNQKIRVITYTNAAANEIKERIGVTEFIESSTIHEFVWSIISNYPRELLICHLEEVDAEIQRKQDKVSQRFLEYLDEVGMERFFQLVEQKEFYRLNSAKEIGVFFNSKDGITNKNEFYSAAKAYISKLKLERTKVNILDYLNTSPTRIKDLFTIKYDHNSNIKNLNKMRIDHDLLLEYFSKMISNYPILKSIIIDKFPILFIDEFQDTNSEVIKIIIEIMQEKKDKCFVVGLFGDFFQNIYKTDNDILEKLIKEEKVRVITKGINRRCPTQVIELANKFNYMCKQESAYVNHNDGTVKLIDINGNLDLKLMELYQNYGKLDCLVLKNKLICEKIQILNIYDTFSSMDNYSGANYENLNTELLSKDFEKLGKTQKIIYKFIEYYFMITDEKIFLNEIAGDNKKINLKDILDFKSKLYDGIETISSNSTLNDVFKIFFGSLENNNLSEKIKMHIFGTNEDIQIIFNEILSTRNDGNPYDILTSLLFDEWIRWYNHVSENDMEYKIIYHTYHGTKGLEYENVVVILDDSLYRKNDDFKNYLLKLVEYSESMDKIILDSNKNLRNLLYVAITRSYKNLFILNNTSIDIDKIEKIFKI